MQTTAQLVRTATQELLTPASPPTTLSPRFVDWLGLKTFGDTELEKAASACQEWASAFKAKAPPRWLSLIGASGTGKTHCAKRLWRYAKQQTDWQPFNYQPRAIFWPEFIQELRAGSAFDLRSELKRWPVLFLDDIGSERDPSGFAAEELNTLLGCRVGKWTLLTSNLDIDGITAVDRRLSSRLIRDRNICVSVKTKDFATR